MRNLIRDRIQTYTLANDPQCRAMTTRAKNESCSLSIEERAPSQSHSSSCVPAAVKSSAVLPLPHYVCSSGRGRPRRMSRLRQLVVIVIAIGFSFVFVSWISHQRDNLVEQETETVEYRIQAAQPAAPRMTVIPAWSDMKLSVVVAHAARPAVLDPSQQRLVDAGKAATTVMLRTQLPSWTLRHVEAECAECLDSETHAAAVQRQGGAAGAAVFATAAAPLGIAGPMLFAMASVTDDVDGAAELARWSWVPRSYAMRRQFSGASPAGLRGGTSPYLVVLGIPSTDQPVRATLRDAQRATWLSYREVARSGNDFRGALLPLYLFAAAERELTSGVTDVSPLLPTVAEYEAASVARLHAGNESSEVPDYSVRRVATSLGAFRDRLLSAEQLLESPCTSVVARTVDGDTARKSTWLAKLTSGLDLPATPAAVAPAQFVCHASAALWQEVLRHRNAVWIDMMTDRKPTTGKKLGQSGDWGLAVEVGMSQKLILWLHYAYHAFPDVPYIMKGDDDTYLKVPQFLRDMRHIRSNYTDVFPEAAPAVRDPPGVEKTERCVYWGGWVRNADFPLFRYHGGNGYLLHRRMVQAMMEPGDPTNDDILYLAVTPFDAKLVDTYKGFAMHVEDACVGGMVHRNLRRIHEVCPDRHAMYVEEGVDRMLDTHMSVWKIGWAAMLLHHVTPFDQYYLHYYFQHEYAVAQDIAQRGKSAERAAIRRAKTWLAARLPNSTPGFGRYNSFLWVHPANVPSATEAPVDKVMVYSETYATFNFDFLDVAYTPSRGG